MSKRRTSVATGKVEVSLPTDPIERARFALNVLDETLAMPAGPHDNYRAAEITRALWAILTMLRGPDDARDAMTKGHTTAPIRSIVLPKTRRSLSGARRAATYAAPTKLRRIAVGHTQIHFRSHANNAINALVVLGYIPNLPAEE